MKMKDKIQAMRKHTQRRMLERYGVRFTKVHRNAMKDLVRSKSACSTLVCKRSNRVYVYDIVYSGKTFRMVWDNQRWEFSTALSLNMQPGANDYYSNIKDEFK